MKISTDTMNMSRFTVPKRAERCSYIRVCYLAESLNCFGYKIDCPLYQKSNGLYFDEKRFDDAMNRLINKTRAKFDKLPK